MINLKIMWKSIKEIKKSKRNIKEVNFNDIKLAEYKLIDVRSKREFSENHLNSAINLPVQELKRSIEKYIKNKDTKILVYCQSGIRSAKAVNILESIGYTQVYNLQGGLENI